MVFYCLYKFSNVIIPLAESERIAVIACMLAVSTAIRSPEKGINQHVLFYVKITTIEKQRSRKIEGNGEINLPFS